MPWLHRQPFLGHLVSQILLFWVWEILQKKLGIIKIVGKNCGNFKDLGGKSAMIRLVTLIPSFGIGQLITMLLYFGARSSLNRLCHIDLDTFLSFIMKAIQVF